MKSRLLIALRRRPGRNIVVLFTVTILVPGLILTAFSVRVLEQDRQLAVREIEQRLDLVAQQAGELLDQELRSGEAAVQRVVKSGRVDAADLPQWMRDAAAAPGNLALAVPGVSVWPTHSVAYLPWQSAVGLTAAGPALGARAARAQALNARAQAERAAGRNQLAAAHFRELIELHPAATVASVPADLVGHYGLCQLAETGHATAICGRELFHDLAQGRWLLEKPRYLWYRNQAELWLRTGAMASEADQLLDRRRRALADALADGLPADRSVLLIRFRPDDSAIESSAAVAEHSEGHVVLLALRREWMRDEWWPRIGATPGGADFEVALADGDHVEVRTPAGPQEEIRTTRHRLGDHEWRLTVRPRDWQQLMAASSARRLGYIAMLGGVVSVLTLGTYFTFRIVRRELEIARMKSDFVSAVSHEFRSPLTGIRQLSEMLVRDRVPTEARKHEYYERIVTESDRLARVVENILDFSKMEDGRRRYQLEEIETSGWLCDIAARVDRTLAGGPHRLVCNIPGLSRISADREALTTAIDNLLDNAIKYSPDGDAVWLTAEDVADSVVIQVRDCGCGIDPSDRPYIFERFYRGNSELTRATRGTGIGLSLVDHIVRAHGGRVDVVSSPGQGSTFSIILPAISAPHAQQVQHV